MRKLWADASQKVWEWVPDTSLDSGVEYRMMSHLENKRIFTVRSTIWLQSGATCLWHLVGLVCLCWQNTVPMIWPLLEVFLLVCEAIAKVSWRVWSVPILDHHIGGKNQLLHIVWVQGLSTKPWSYSSLSFPPLPGGLEFGSCAVLLWWSMW